MKIRNGFVSNSSSSSFILLGVKLNDNIEEVCKKIIPENIIKESLENEEDWGNILCENDEYSEFDTIYCGYSGDIYFGKVLSNSEEIENGSLDMNEMNDIVNNIKTKLGDQEIKLYYGTYGC